MCNGKPGEVKRLDCIEQSGEMVKEIFGNDSYNFQANSEKHEKRFVLVEEMMDSARKLYLSITPDYFSSFYWVLATAEENKVNAGGNQAPHGSAYKLAINPFAGLRPQQACEFARALGLTGYLGEEYADLIHNTYRLCLDKECSLVEIDPLVITKEGWLVAQEARISFDEDAVYYR
jgi:succinyl-CoA synthetase beta subunit